MVALIVSNLRRRKGRTLLAALGIGVGVATIVALLSIGQGLKNTASGLIHLGNADFGVFQSDVSDPTASVLPDRLVRRIAAQPGVAAASPLLLVTQSIKQDPAAIVFGLKPGDFPWNRVVPLEGARPVTGRHQVMLGDHLAALLHRGVGQSVVIKHSTFQISGIYHTGVLFEDIGAVMPLPDAQQLAQRKFEETTIAVVLQPTVKRNDAARAIERAFPGTTAIGDPGEAARAGANNTLIANAVLVIVVVALIVGGISVTNTMILAVIERQGELALLATIGWSPLRIAALILGEGVGVSLVGAGLGLLFGVIGSRLLVHALSVSEFVSPAVTAWGLGRGLLVGVAIGVLGGLYPAWRVTRLQPAQVLARA